MYAVKCLYRTTFRYYADNERTGIIWTPRFETIEKALLYAQEAVRKWGYEPKQLKIVLVKE